MNPSICEHCSTEEPQPGPPQKARVSVFFDGTGNNRSNARARNRSDASYGSAPSNVAKGEENMEDYQGVDNEGYHYYIEGIGTRTDGTDVPQGMVEGRGITGVTAKMNRGIARVISDLSQLDVNRPIELVEIDAFGFSRGAAAARYFVHVALHDHRRNIKRQLEDLGFRVGAVVVKFVGLYDTVASHGFNHDSDTTELKLDAVKDAAYTFQLAAGDEHRANFRLTDIQSARAGRQVFLPGVHSDIGGGYNDFAAETDHQVVDLDMNLSASLRRDQASVRRERQWLIDRGWYRARELDETNFFWEIHANRRNIRNTYANVALNMMADEARPQGVPFKRLLSIFHPIPSDPNVRAVIALIDASIAAGNEAKNRSWRDHWLQMSHPALNEVRHRYFHMSSRFGESAGAHAPNYTAHPSDGGVRQRVVQRG